jgi:hypothetical protein
MSLQVIKHSLTQSIPSLKVLQLEGPTCPPCVCHRAYSINVKRQVPLSHPRYIAERKYPRCAPAWFSLEVRLSDRDDQAYKGIATIRCKKLEQLRALRTTYNVGDFQVRNWTCALSLDGDFVERIAPDSVEGDYGDALPFESQRKISQYFARIERQERRISMAGYENHNEKYSVPASEPSYFRQRTLSEFFDFEEKPKPER